MATRKRPATDVAAASRGPLPSLVTLLLASGSDSPTARTAAETSAPGPPKKRKPTHTVRKEEINHLQDEVDILQHRLEQLRQRVRRAQYESPHAIPNALLRDAIHEQHLALANAHSMVSQFVANDTAQLAHCYIHLTRPSAERRRILQSVKAQQLAFGRGYLIERSRYVALTKPHASSEVYETPNGDTSCVRFSLVQFPPGVTARDVFEAATFYTSHLEISFTDGTGHVTIREVEEDTGDDNISQHHVLTTVAPGLLVEGNFVVFTDWDEFNNCGLVSCTFVDRDDLYPYRPAARIRHDVTAALLIAVEEGIVVMRRMAHVKIHHNAKIRARRDILEKLSEGVTHWGNALIQYAIDRGTLGATRPNPQDSHTV